MSGTIPARVEAELFESAKRAGKASSRSATQQLAHWARIGRAIEEARGISVHDVSRVLAGRASYDDLSAIDQAVVRSAWDEEIESRLTELDLAAEFRSAGHDYVELDDEGNLVTRSG